MATLGEAWKGFSLSYAEYPKIVKTVDLFVVAAILTAVAQFLYVCIVGTFPFNSFLSGFVSAIGTAILFGKIV